MSRYGRVGGGSLHSVYCVPCVCHNLRDELTPNIMQVWGLPHGKKFVGLIMESVWSL